jgi:CHRD domain
VKEIHMRHLLRLIALVAPMLMLLVSVCQAIPFTASLDGPSENPPVPSPGTGTAFVDFDIVANTLHVEASFSDLVGLTTVAHIHCCVAPPGTAGVATTTPTFPGFPVGVMSGTYDMDFDTTLASTYNPAFVTANGGTVAAAEAALFAGMTAGLSYFNIHTDFRPGGEIRGFLQPAQVPGVPAPGSLVLLAIGLAGFGTAVRMRQPH